MRIYAPRTAIGIEYQVWLMAGCNHYDKIRTYFVIIGPDVHNAARAEGSPNKVFSDRTVYITERKRVHNTFISTIILGFIKQGFDLSKTELHIHQR